MYMTVCFKLKQNKKTTVSWWTPERMLLWFGHARMRKMPIRLQKQPSAQQSQLWSAQQLTQLIYTTVAVLYRANATDFCNLCKYFLVLSNTMWHTVHCTRLNTLQCSLFCKLYDLHNSKVRSLMCSYVIKPRLRADRVMVSN